MLNHLIAPSILSADFARLGEEIHSVLIAGADWIHFDVMDNHYVPNLTIGPLVCKAIRHYAIKNGEPVYIDVHLMVQPVDRLALDFIKAGANIITFHPEASPDVNYTLDLIRKYGCLAGLAFNPETSLQYLTFNILSKVDLVLFMSVNPGFGGQSFLAPVLSKIKNARNILDQYIQNTGKLIYLEVDGGIKIENIASVAKAGADVFVSGSAIFGQEKKYKNIIQKMRKELEKTK